jgi:hypothetical protein
MTVDAFLSKHIPSVTDTQRRSQVIWWLMYVGMIGITGVMMLFMYTQGPSWSMIAWIIYLMGMVAIFYNPRYGVYLILFLTLMGDQAMLYWYPFIKNFSSAESLMYLNGSVNLSPLESYIALTLFVWFGRMAMERKFSFYAGPILIPALLFAGFITVGFLYGVSRGGVLSIALWEVRSIYYLPVMLILTGNLIRTREHVNRMMWLMVIALGYKGIMGMIHVATQLNWDLSGVERIAEHSMSIQFNAFFMLMITVWFYHDSALKRLILPMLAPFVFYSFFANQRRASFLTLGLGVAVVLSMLYRENRKLFFTLAPTGAVAFLVYLAAFWNNTGSIGIIARAVRSVIGQPTARDAASNIYRDIENVNTMFNIKNSPLFGIGFGNKFYMIVPLPDISFFIWWEYITHNSIMWIWMQAGVGAFFSMLLLTGMTMIVGGRAVWNVPAGPLRAVALTGTLYVFMHFTYAYADMSWEVISMTFVGTMMGLINALEPISKRTLPVPVPRWPWVPAHDQPPPKRWPWVPDAGVIPPYHPPKVWPWPIPAYRAAQMGRAKERAARATHQ